MEDPSSSGHYNLNTSVTWTIYNLGARAWERQDCDVRILVSIVQEVKNLSTLKIYGGLISKFCWKSFGISEQQYTALTFVPYFCNKTGMKSEFFSNTKCF